MDTTAILKSLCDLQQLRVLWCDNANVIRNKAIFLPALLARESNPTAIIDHLDHAVTVTAAIQSAPVTHDEPVAAAGLGPVQDICLKPVWETLSVCPTNPRIGSVMGNMMLGKEAWLHCPRQLLQRVQAAAVDRGIELQAGFELEFFLLHDPMDTEGDLCPVDHALFASTIAAQKSEVVIGEILDSLWAQGISVAQYNPEAGPGQHEISIDHCEPLELADCLVKMRETVRSVARRHGQLATFVPVLHEDTVGSGLHTHFSLWRNGQDLLPDPSQPYNLCREANQFMAGMLFHLPAMMAITTPNVNSFYRTRPHEWSGAYQAWGIENKEAAIRLINGPRNRLPMHFELKTVDCAANPYIALACMIAAGLDGIDRQLELPAPVPIDPGNYSEAERERLAIERLPVSLDQALLCLASDHVIQEALGEEFTRVFAAIRQAEFQIMHEMSVAEQSAVLLERF